MEVLNETFDSIALQESMIFTNGDETPITKEDVKYNLTRFASLLQTQREKIDRLEAQLRESSDSTEQSLHLIAYLRQQMSIKDSEIAQLREELEKKNVDLARLQGQVQSQTVTINELSQRTQKQSEALARQDAMLNNGYVMIASKDELTRKGILKKGKLVSNAIMDRSAFIKVDIREWREVSFFAKKPYILTDMPTSSYELTTAGNKTFTLRVLTPADFWRISNYLVSHTD
ncbi:MAG: hypothetical protein LUC44_03195 [Prevotellaceae bacterium]|nr:hypothetical protein [Prevotellaceae bacterium]